jgi:Flp pilus assembly protein TadG
MAMSPRFLHSLRARIRAFGGERSGNVTLTFALALIPLVGLAGSAVDYSRGNSAKAAMQAAADATALMLSKEAANLTSAQIKSKAIDYFNANFNRTDVSNVQIAPSYATSGGSQIVVTATGTLPTSLLKPIFYSSRGST